MLDKFQYVRQILNPDLEQGNRDMKKLLLVIVCTHLALIVACSPPSGESAVASVDSAAPVGGETLDSQVDEYIRLFPYQDTFNYAKRYTGGDPNKLNVWVLGIEPALVKAGEDTVVRMNNDTFYKMAFVSLKNGPVYLDSSAPTTDRFVSFQLMDDRNANYRNVIHPDGEYTLFHGEKPAQIRGEAIEVPSELSVIIVRVEVRAKDDPVDIAAAKVVFNGITISGDPPVEFPVVDLLGDFSEEVVAAADQKLDETFASVPFGKTVAGPGQEPGREVSFVNFAAGTKGGWGGPATSHSSYETIFFDKNGEKLQGRSGPYTVTTEEPSVDAFWSITVYDTDRGGYLHPNDEDRYHINNTGAVRNDDGTITFLFKQSCERSDVNCLEVPAGHFDLAARYYLPDEAIESGEWTLPKITMLD